MEYYVVVEAVVATHPMGSDHTATVAAVVAGHLPHLGGMASSPLSKVNTDSGLEYGCCCARAPEFDGVMGGEAGSYGDNLNYKRALAKAIQEATTSKTPASRDVYVLRVR